MTGFIEPPCDKRKGQDDTQLRSSATSVPRSAPRDDSGGHLAGTTMPHLPNSSISRESFNQALETIQNIRTTYAPQEGQDYYNNPEAALDRDGEYFLAPLIYWCRDQQDLTENQELADAIQIVTRHCRDHYHNKGELEVFETIIAPLANDAVMELNQTETPKLPMIYPRDVKDFVSTLRHDPYYAIGFLAQSTEALADIRNGIGDNRANIQKILNYVVPYYQDRAPADQAGLMLFALDQAIVENPMGYSNAAIAGLRAHRETIENNTKNRTEEEVTEIEELRENLHKAQRACAVIARQNFENHPDFIRAGKVLAALNNNQTPETRTAELANPAQWIFGTSIQIGTLTAFLHVMRDLGTQRRPTDEQTSAFQALQSFSDKVLSSWAANNSFKTGKKFCLAEAIADHQRKFDMMASAALLEETTEGLQGLQKAVQGSVPRDSEGQQRLIDYIRALSRKQLKSSASQVQHTDIPRITIQATLSEMLKKDMGSLVLLEQVIADESLSSQEKEALDRVYDEIVAHYADRSGFLIRLQDLRAAEAAPALRTIPGLETLPEFLSELEMAPVYASRAGIPTRETSSREWFLNDSPYAKEVMFLAPMYGAILQGLIEQDPSTPAATNALKVLTYIQAYVEAGNKGKEFDVRMNTNIKPILDFAKTRGQEEAFLRALKDVVAAGALWREIETSSDNSDSSASENLAEQMGNCIATRYNVDGKDKLFEIAKQNDEAQNPVVSVAILQDNYDLKGISDLLPRIQENPETALWDTARWLAELRSRREYEHSDFNKNPEMHRAAERIEAYIKGKFLETTWWLKLDTLVQDMHKAGKASYSFHANGLLDKLCRDGVKTENLEPEKYASLILEMQWARDHDADKKNKQNAAALLPFLSQAMDRFPEFRSQVDREKTRIQAFIDASRKVSFSNHPEFNDTNGLINAWNKIHPMGQYALLIENVIDDIEAGVISPTSEQRQYALTFQGHVQRVIEANGWDHETYFRENIALKAIVNAELPEFNEIRDALCHRSIIDCESVLTLWDDERCQPASFGGSFRYYQESVSHLPEKVLFATEQALSRQDELPPRLVSHLHVVMGGILEYWQAWERRCKDGNTDPRFYRSAHEAFKNVVEVLGEQQKLVLESQASRQASAK